MAIELYDAFGALVHTFDQVDDFLAEGMPFTVVWGARLFARNTDGRYVELGSVPQPVFVPANRPLPALGATDGRRFNRSGC